MESIQHLLDSATIPAVAALILGLLTALDPCSMATNITAIGYISREIESRRRIFLHGLLYTLGRTIAYTALGAAIIPLVRVGSTLFDIQHFFAKYQEIIFAPMLIVVGLFILLRHKLNLPKIGFNAASLPSITRGWGALILGALFSMAFCPATALLYFGVMIPIAAAEHYSYLLLIIYSIATSLPVIIIAWLLAYSVSQLGLFYKGMGRVEKWMNIVVAALFIISGVILMIGL